MKKSQTATEYLIILAVVIVISLITIGVLGGVPSMGGGSSKNAKIAEIKNQKIGVDSFYVNDSYAKLKIRNNDEFTLSIVNVSIDEDYCGTWDLPLTLKMGETIILECTGTYTDHSGGRTVPKIGILYRNINTGALYQTNNFISSDVLIYDLILNITKVDNFGGASLDLYNDLLVYNSNFYAVGNAASDLDSFPGGSANLGNFDFVITKYNSSLDFIEVSNFGGALDDNINKILLSNGNFISVGASKSDLTAIGGSTNVGNFDFAIMNLNPDTLNLNAIQNYGGTLIDMLYSIIELDGYYYAVGASESDLSSFPGGSTNSGDYDFVILKIYENNLTVADMNYFGGSQEDEFVRILSYRNDIYVFGYSASDLSSFPGGSNTEGGLDVTVAKFDKDTLDLINLNNFGGLLDEKIFDCTYSEGYFYCSGSSYSNLQTLGGSGNAGNADCLVLKINPITLELVDLMNFGGSEFDFLSSIIISGNNIYVSGQASSDLSSLPGGSTSASNDFLISKLNKTNLELIDLENTGGTGADIIYESILYDGHIYFAGYTWSDLSSFPGGSNSAANFWDLAVGKVE